VVGGGAAHMKRRRSGKISPQERLADEAPVLRWKAAPGLAAIARNASGELHRLTFSREEFRAGFLKDAAKRPRTREAAF
jgi:hypothetical protein